MESITKEITFMEDDRLISSRYCTNGHDTDYYSLKMLKPPVENYTVTYRLDSQGPFRVFQFGSYMAVMAVHPVDFGDPVVAVSRKEWAPICFLPLAWDGQRVSRTVEVKA